MPKFLLNIVLFALLLMRVSLYGQTCSTNKITSGTFNENPFAGNIGWTKNPNNGWRYSNRYENLVIDRRGIHTATSPSITLCPNTPKQLKFKLDYIWGGTADPTVQVRLGGVLYFTATVGYWAILHNGENGASVTKSGDIYTVDIPNYSGSENGAFQIIYTRNENAESKIVILDNVEVYELKPDKPTPTSTELFYCKGSKADLTEAQPTPTPAGITYEWHDATNTSTTSLVSNTGAVTSGTYYLYAKNCDNCYSEPSNMVTVTENPLPNNTSNGFKGEYICLGEKTAKLYFNAINSTFVKPYTIVYKNIDTNAQYSQVVTSDAEFDFTPGDNPTAVGDYNYELISITNGNGCTKTSDFGKKTALIKIFQPPVCGITGSDGPVCPNTNLTYTAPSGMTSYNWTITGNGTISGATDTQTVNVVAGNNNSTTFTLTLTIIEEVHTSTNKTCETTCSKTVTVKDDQKPTFNTPANLSVCVSNLLQANYSETTNGDVNNPEDYYEFANNDTSLDITNINDNCCNTGNTVAWRITPDSNGTTISGTGQPSTSIGGKQLWLDIATNNPKASYTAKDYTITYTVTDCNGNKESKTATIIIKPRPKIIKQN